MTSKSIPLFEQPQDNPTKYDGLLGWSADWKCYLDQENKPFPLDEIESLDPDEESVTVQKGDTLGKIAKEHNCTINEIASLNNIKNPALIYPGDVLKLPSKEYHYPEVEDETNDDQCIVSLKFEDLIEKPLADLKVKITSSLGDVYEAVTDGLGKIENYTVGLQDELKIFVSSATGKVKEVATFKPLPGKVNVILSSPKVRVKGKSAAIKGPAENVENKKSDINAINIGRDSQGVPRVHITHPCPNSYDLLLRKNMVYWDEIIAASERSGIIPQSIAAVINAESAKRKDGEWKADSVCMDKNNKYRSSAAGMTQFLNGTWITETLREGTYLFEKASAQGLIADKPMLDKKGNVIKNKNDEIIYEKKFQVSADVWMNFKEIKKEKYISGVTPYPKRATVNLQNWLNRRFEAEYAIMAAVDYGLANLSALTKAGYKIDGLDDAEKAKIIYLTHHLGLSDAKKFIRQEITEDRAKILLIAQIKTGPAAKLRENFGNYITAHREWLMKYINNMIVSEGYCCQELTKTLSLKKTRLEEILEKI